MNATPVSPATRGGQAALSVQGNLRSALDQFDAMEAKMQAFVSQTPGGQMTQVATYFGIVAADGQTAEEKAQAFFDETEALKGIINTARAGIEQWCARVG